MPKPVLLQESGVVVNFPDEWSDEQINNSIMEKVDPTAFQNKQKEEAYLIDVAQEWFVDWSNTLTRSKDSFIDAIPNQLITAIIDPSVEPHPDQPGMYRKKRIGLGFKEGLKEIQDYDLTRRGDENALGGEVKQPRMAGETLEQMALRGISKAVFTRDKVYTQTEVDDMSARGEQLRSYFAKKLENSQNNYQKWLSSHPEWQPREDYGGPALEKIKENPLILFDPKFVLYRIAGMTAFTTLGMGSFGITLAATKNPRLAAMASMAVTGPLVEEELYSKLKDNGATDKEASDITAIFGPPIIAVEFAGDIVPWMNILAPFNKKFQRELIGVVAERSMLKRVGMTLYQTAKGVVLSDASETLEEIIQEAGMDVAAKMVNRDYELYQNIPEVAVSSAIGMLGFSSFAGGGRGKAAWSTLQEHNDRKPMGKQEFDIKFRLQKAQLEGKEANMTLSEEESIHLNSIRKLRDKDGNIDMNVAAAMYGIRFEERKEDAGPVVKSTTPQPFTHSTKLEQALDSLQGEKFTGPQLLGQLKKKGVSDADLDNLLHDVLTDPETGEAIEGITKQEVMDLYKIRKFIVEEVKWGITPESTLQSEYNRFLQRVEENDIIYKRTSKLFDEALSFFKALQKRRDDLQANRFDLSEELADGEITQEEYDKQDKEIATQLAEVGNKLEEADLEVERTYDDWAAVRDEGHRLIGIVNDIENTIDIEDDDKRNDHYRWSAKQGWDYMSIILKLPEWFGNYFGDVNHYSGDEITNMFAHIRRTLVKNFRGETGKLIQEIQGDWTSAVSKHGTTGVQYKVEYTDNGVQKSRFFDTSEAAEKFYELLKERIQGDAESTLSNVIKVTSANQLKLWTVKYTQKDAKGNSKKRIKQYKTKELADAFAETLEDRATGITVKKTIQEGKVPFNPLKNLFSVISLNHMVMRAVKADHKFITWVSGTETRNFYSAAMQKAISRINYRTNSLVDEDGNVTYKVRLYDKNGTEQFIKTERQYGLKSIDQSAMTEEEINAAFGGYIADMIANGKGRLLAPSDTLFNYSIEYGDVKASKIKAPDLKGLTLDEYDAMGPYQRDEKFKYTEQVDIGEYYYSYQRYAVTGVHKGGKERTQLNVFKSRKDANNWIRRKLENGGNIEGADIKIGGEWATRMYGDFEADIVRDFPNRPEMLQFAYDGKDNSRMSIMARNLVKRYGGKVEFIHATTSRKEDEKPSTIQIFFNGKFNSFERMGGKREDWEIFERPQEGEPTTYGLKFKGTYVATAATLEDAKYAVDVQVRLGTNPSSEDYTVETIKNQTTGSTKYQAYFFDQPISGLYTTEEGAEEFIKNELGQQDLDVDMMERRGFYITEALANKVRLEGLQFAADAKARDFAAQHPSEDDVAYGGTEAKQEAFNNFVTLFGQQGRINKEIHDQLRKQGYIDFRGLKFTTLEELADIAAAYRDPTIEQFQVVFIDENTGEILAHSVETIGHPGLAIPSNLYDNLANKLENFLSRGINAKFYILHNHPTGNANPSESDILASQMVRRAFGDLFKGQLVLDHDHFYYIDDKNSSEQRHKLEYAKGEKPKWAGDFNAVELIKSALVPVEKGYWTILFVDGEYNILGVGRVNTNDPTVNKWQYIKDNQRAHMAQHYIIVSNGAMMGKQEVIDNRVAGFLDMLILDENNKYSRSFMTFNNLLDKKSQDNWHKADNNLSASRQAFPVYSAETVRLAAPTPGFLPFTKVLGEDGKPKILYSGHMNVSLYGKFDLTKATAGAYFATVNSKIASSYAMGKMGVKEYYENGSQYVTTRGKNQKRRIWSTPLTREQKDIIIALENSKVDDADSESLAYELSEYKRWRHDHKEFDKDARRAFYNPYDLMNIWKFMENMGFNIVYDDDAAFRTPEGEVLGDGSFSDYLVRKFDREKIKAPAAKTLTDESLKELEESVVKTAGLESLSLYKTKQGDIKLSMIEVKRGERKHGIGTRAMNLITDYADEVGARIILTVGQKDDSFGTTSRARLVKFYKRFDFVENKGKDFTISEGMFRRPGKAPKSKSTQTEYAQLGPKINDLDILSEVPNKSSIDATLGGTDYEILPGKRAVPFADFGDPQDTFYAVNDKKRSRALAEEIKESGEISPLIVVLEDEGPYILEGGHRFVALSILGYKTFPAVVVDARTEVSGEFSYEAYRNNKYEHLRKEFDEKRAVADKIPYYERQKKNRFERMMDLLKIKWESYEQHRPGVQAVYLDIRNPIVVTYKDSADTVTGVKATMNIPANVLEELEKAAEKEPERDYSPYEDKWTKDYALGTFLNDIKEGDPFWATQIPTEARRIFKKHGFDGIRDVGGKSGGEEHEVWIAFDTEQIHSAWSKEAVGGDDIIVANDARWAKEGMWEDDPNTPGEDVIEEIDKVDGTDAEVKSSKMVRMRDTTLAKRKAEKLLQGIRKGGVIDRQEVKRVQGVAKAALQGLNFAGKGELMGLVTGTLTQAQLDKNLVKIADRMQKIIDRLKIEAYVKAIKRLSEYQNIDPTYKEQIDDLLEAYDLKRRSKKTKAAIMSRADFLTLAIQSGDMQGIPSDLFDGLQAAAPGVYAGKVTLDEMSEEEVRQLHDAVALLSHVGRLKSELLGRAEKRTLEEEVTKLVNIINDKTSTLYQEGDKWILRYREPTRMVRKGKKLKETKQPIRRLTKTFDTREEAQLFLDMLYGKSKLEQAQTLSEEKRASRLHKLRRMIGGFSQSLINAEHKMDTLGISDLFERLNEGINAKKRLGKLFYDKLKDAHRKLGDYSEKMFETERFEFAPHEGNKERVVIDMPRQRMIGIALNAGNQGNRERLRKGLEMSDANIDEVISKLTDAEKQFVEDIWTLFDELYPYLNDTAKKMLGVPVKRVEGRYFPIVVDRAMSKLQQARDAAQDLFTSVFQSAYLNRGFTYTRKGGSEAVNLDVFGLIPQHMDNVIAYVTMAIPVRDAQKIINHPRFKAAIERTEGAAMYDEFRKNLIKIANPHDRTPTNWFEGLVGGLRHNATAAILMLKVSVSLVQALSGFLAFYVLSKRVGRLVALKYTLRAIIEQTNPLTRKSLTEFIHAADPNMAQRRTSFDRELKDYLAGVGGKRLMRGDQKGLSEKTLKELMNITGWDKELIQEIGFVWIAGIDEWTVNGAWKGAFDAFMATNGGDFDAAVREAASIIRLTQPMGDAAYLPSVMTGNEFQKMFTTFMSFFSRSHNVFVQELDTLKYSRNHPLRKAANFMEFYIVAMAIPAMLATFIKSGGEEDDPWAYLKDLAIYNTAGIPLVRDFVNSGLKGFDFGKTPALSAGEYLIYGMKAKTWEGRITNLAKGGALSSGLVPIQFIVTAQGIYDNFIADNTDDLRRLIFSEYQLHGSKGKAKPPR